MSTCFVRFISNEHVGEVFKLSEQVLLIGRSRSCDIKFSAPDVSGRHIELSCNPVGLPVLHNISLRKTLLNGCQVVHESVSVLKQGDVIQLGDEVSLEVMVKTDEKTGIPSKTLVTQDDVSDAALATVVDTNQTEPSAAAVNLSTVVDEAAVPLPGTVSSDDETIILGNETEAESLPSQQPILNDTAVQISPTEVGGNETMIMRTLIASPDEIDMLRRRQGNASKKKMMVYLVGALVAVGIVTASWLVSAVNKEKRLTYPVDINGELNDDEIFPNDELGRDFLIYFPKHKDMVVSKQPNRVVVETRIGKFQDVPLRLEYTASKSLDHLYVDRKEAFQAWIDNKMSMGGKWNFSSISDICFCGRNNGFPYVYAEYNRLIGTDSWFGVAMYFRYKDWAFVLLKEIPTGERWRGERLLVEERFVSASPSLIERHWERTGELLTSPIGNLLDEARSMLGRTVPAMWPQISKILNSVMVRSLRDDDLASYEKANDMLCQLRRVQTKWLNAQKLAYYNSLSKERDRDAATIRNACRSVFSDENDQRYHFIRKDQWE